MSSSFTPAAILPPPTPTSASLTCFTPLSTEAVHRPATACPIDPITSSLLQGISSDILPFLNTLINSSLTRPDSNTARVKPLLKKPTLDTADIQYYRPASRLHTPLRRPSSGVTESLRAARAASLSSVLILLALSAGFDTITRHGFSYHCYADDTQLFLSFPPSATLVATCISECLADISTWTTVHHLKLNLDKTELLFVPGKDCPHMLQCRHPRSGPILQIRSLQHPHKEGSTALGPSAHHLSPRLLQLAPGWTPCLHIKPLQRIQNATVRLMFNLPKFSHVTPLFHDLHWLPVVACIRFKTMVLVYKAVNGTALTYLQAMLTSAGRLIKVAEPSHNSSLFWCRYGGTSFLPLSGQQSRSPTPVRNSILICSEFNWSLHSPPLHLCVKNNTLRV
ncbi:hypothetical protein N1851_009106 [Merluccius polli]|uniref:Reverse transcriptase domain-containing protein n=1 Tax=Merluccius polli TaxID=89951 RepID=A0AA47N1U2_MERPO|nr:hypothetical protein N1851_009106 [Merluccius polli]